MSLVLSRSHGALITLVALGAACRSSPPGELPGADSVAQEFSYERARQEMVARQIRARGVTHEGVVRAMGEVPRHEFVPYQFGDLAYDDRPLPIGYRQTISQPYVVALMTELIAPEPADRVLEVGTGSGYQAAVAAELVAEVYSIELIPELAASAAERLQRLGYDNVHVRAGDGYLGWPEHAPFDGILVTAGADHVPQPLVDQLAVGGRMVIPVGDTQLDQVLRVIEKRPDGSIDSRDVVPVRFVPLLREPGA
jgi:protein-L-isoaspartate(D-aspartate) O-methyltransferase